jgi:serine/threonine-protein kinase PknG
VTTTTTQCTQPGCGGTIEDGYCSVCGMAAAPATAAPATAAPASAVPAAPALCTQPGCGGTIEDGYCTVCGMAAAPAPVPVTAADHERGSFPASAGTGGSMGTRGSTGTRGTHGSTGRSSRGNLGAGLVEVPPVPAHDPASAILADPQVPESRRFCPNCQQPVGRARDGRPGLAEGFCRNCGARFSFTPKLKAGDLVGGQYEVLGCLAHGGLGWIYLAKDRNVSDSWRVLKGLLSTGDADAMAAAVAERQFLAAVDHPNIVRIYNFVQHTDQHSGETAGYIVMEYVGGRSLRQILLDERKAGRSVPVEHALAYAIEVLRALGYLHSRGLVYCDFKPDNVIQSEEMLKLIDMGGVRRIDDEDSPIYGTVGYQAPEIAADGPSPSSDLYTVGRALAVLTFEFTGYTSTYQHTLPDPATVPLLARQESFYRLLRRATNPDPARRFASAGDMAEQLTGVLREVLAAGDGSPRPAFSSLFSPELQAVGAEAGEMDGSEWACAVTALPPATQIVAGLPVPQVDITDPAAGYLASLGTLDPAQITATLSAAVHGEAGTPPAVAESAETRLALARALIVTGALGDAASTLAELAARDSADWRITWYQGLRELASGHPGEAQAAFDAVYDALPGELAPQLALGFAAEAAGDHATAARYFERVWMVDRSYVSAALGLARAKLAADDRPGAIAALAAVPPTSSHHVVAQVAAVRINLTRTGQSGAGFGELREAAGRLGRLPLDAARRQQLTSEILRAALDAVTAGQPAGGGHLLGCEPAEYPLRSGLEQSYRALARLAPDQARRIELVDQANEVRPRTWL